MRSVTALLLAGGLMAAIASPVSAQIPFSMTEAGGNIEDANLTMFSLTLPGDVGDLLSLELDINGLSHTNPEDLEFYLIKPTVGAITVLQDQGDGVAVPNATYPAPFNLTFSDLGSPPLGGSDPLVPGSYQPVGVEGFDKFVNGTSAGAGLWTLVVIDDSAGDDGSFDSWTLRGTYVPEPVTASLLALGAVATLRRRRR